jgi:hypothetical protein
MSDAIPEDATHASPQAPAGGRAANTTAMDDDDDNDSLMDEHDEAAAAARAAAEVETHGHTANANNAPGNNNNNNVPADQAVMGAVQDNGTGDGVANFEVMDESGSLVQQRFLQFLTD